MRRTLLILAAVAALLGACSEQAAGPCKPTHIVRDGEPLPDCSFEKMDGGTLALKDLRGKPLVLNFWTSWCPACVREMPALQAVADRYSGRVQVVGMDGLGVLDETRELAKEYAEKRGVRYTIAFDVDGRLYSHFFGTLRTNPVYPLTLYVDAEGIVKKTVFGEQSEEDLRSNIAEYLGVR